MKVEINGKVVLLEAGDRVVSPITSLQFSKHHAIYIGNYNGIPHFIENIIGIGVRLINAHAFFQENIIISSVQKFQGNPLQRNEIIKDAIKRLGGKYNLLFYNCEHFANEIQNKKIRSKQAETGIFLAIVFLLLYSTNKN